MGCYPELLVTLFVPPFLQGLDFFTNLELSLIQCGSVEMIYFTSAPFMVATSLRCTASQVITLARMPWNASSLVRSSAADENWTSQLHQSPRPRLSERLYCPKLIVEHHLAQMHARQQKDAIVQ